MFRGHFFGRGLWIGNPDRLNSDLKVLTHYLSGLSSGHIDAWNEHEMMGYDSFVLPYTFPNPIVYLVALFGEENRLVTMGYVMIAMLASAGLAAYCFLRAGLPAGLPVLVGAVCYEFSSLSVLKVSQNSMSFAVFIMIPLLALAVRSIRRETASRRYLMLAVLLGAMLSLMFLQKAAYALMLVGAYAAWRSLSVRSWRPMVIFALALGTATLFSLPRVLGVATAMHEYARVVEGWNLKDFDVLYAFQNIQPYQIYRWFDYAIFGHNPSETLALGTNSISPRASCFTPPLSCRYCCWSGLHAAAVNGRASFALRRTTQRSSSGRWWVALSQSSGSPQPMPCSCSSCAWTSRTPGFSSPHCCRCRSWSR